MILCDREIRDLCLPKWQADPVSGLGPKGPMIEPFSEPVQGDGVVSYGLTSAGYDLRLGNEVWVYKNTSGLPIDPKKFKDETYKRTMFDRMVVRDHDPVVIPAHAYILGSTYEYLRIPRRLKGRVTGKSTYARSGIIVNMTPLEPGWEGNLTIEISNSAPCPALVYVGEGICQLELEVLSSEPETDYAQKGGKYQNQQGVTAAIVR